MKTVSIELAIQLHEAGLREPVSYSGKSVWLPTLSDLLDWLEKRVNKVTGGNGWWFNTFQRTDGKWQYNFVLSEGPAFYELTAEDAVANAVLWVLQNENK